MVGIVDAVCPYCNTELIKKPGRKKKCPQCGNFIYVRTSPKTNEKILVTDSQRDIIEEQWCIVNGTHAEFKQNKKKIEQNMINKSTPQIVLLLSRITESILVSEQ